MQTAATILFSCTFPDDTAKNSALLYPSVESFLILWYRIKADSTEGYVKAEFFEKQEGTLMGLAETKEPDPVVEPTTVPEETSSAGVLLIFT